MFLLYSNSATVKLIINSKKTQKTIITMKKIFLLSLLSVLLLSAFSQTKPVNPEIITKISITKSTENGELQYIPPDHGWWIFFWREVVTIPMPNGGIVITCTGFGLKICIAHLRDVPALSTWCNTRGIDVAPIENTYNSLYDECDERIANGEFRGSITKKIACPGMRETYLLFQMDWENDPVNPRNGQAEITISQTNSLGF